MCGLNIASSRQLYKIQGIAQDHTSTLSVPSACCVPTGGFNPLSQLGFQLKTAEYVHLKKDTCSQSSLLMLSFE